MLDALAKTASKWEGDLWKIKGANTNRSEVEHAETILHAVSGLVVRGKCGDGVSFDALAAFINLWNVHVGRIPAETAGISREIMADLERLLEARRLRVHTLEIITHQQGAYTVTVECEGCPVDFLDGKLEPLGCRIEAEDRSGARCFLPPALVAQSVIKIVVSGG